ncbi:MAG: ribonuclease R [Clostridiales bacterium]|nr:ribonuclease R [Clostridiales bacterium]
MAKKLGKRTGGTTAGRNNGGKPSGATSGRNNGKNAVGKPDAGRRHAGGGRSGGTRPGTSRPRIDNNGLERGDVLAGVFEGSGRGFGFLRPDDRAYGDVFVPPDACGDALSGDRVRIVMTGFSRGGGEGEVTEILTRRDPEFVGLYKSGVIYPDEKGLNEGGVTAESSEPRLPGGRRLADGDKVVARLVDYRRPLCAEITEVLGAAGDTDAEIMGIIRTFKLREVFPKKVKREAEAVPAEVDGQSAAGRRDYRKQACVTIDGADSKDFDDAVFAEKTKTGYKLYVHIADVAHYVGRNTALDAEALLRGTSVYFADRVLPMLPERLSNGICSLNEGVDRLVLTCEMTLDERGAITGHELVEGVIRSAARMTYTDVQKILDGDKSLRAAYKKITPMLLTAAELAARLRERRAARGAVDFDMAETTIDVDKKGKVLDVRRAERLFSHRLIEECMLAANETVAEQFARLKAPFVYRVHEAPPPEKVAAFQAFLSPMAIEFPDSPAPGDYAALIAGLDEALRPIVSRVALRSLSKADYRPACLGHYGLAAEFYCHFTSPIRRYPDLCIHRIIKQYLHDGPKSLSVFAGLVKDASVSSSETERRADEAARKVDDYLMAQFMADKIGEAYDAVVSGVTEWGLFCELENGIEGLLRVEALPGSGYRYDADRHTLSRPGQAYRLGEPIKIKVESAHFDKINFVLP